MDILGYSERGAVNSLLYEISYSPNPYELLRRLLDHALFASGAPPNEAITDAISLIEQSLSDFGDADAILLLESASFKWTVFVEAKIKPSQVTRWTLSEEFARFQQGLSTRVSSSNLFSQLYFKSRFVHAAVCGDGTLQAGVAFPACAAKTRGKRRIGNNPVVNRAAQLILPYLTEVWYVAMVPDESNIEEFVRTKLRNLSPAGFDRWDVSKWGFLRWSDVHAFCESEQLTRTLNVLKFNEGQIWA